MTLEEFLKGTLCKMGIQEATGLDITFKDGRKFSIHSDDHPALRQPVDPETPPTVRPVQSAQGG